ncbi:MAG: metal ABC transporter substrate-binding protein [Candidatus Omnitrophica bacterium]|nr:metal ABC transporter substrate-binding protein [Candidatus Omnitrophota bacterium]MDD5539956.1 metal ABC transporter substrate-binding protein [Candidatus Neomarinimicrobiota bacterium]
MFRLKYFVVAVIIVFLSARPCYTAEAPLKVVATQTMYADIAKEIGKDKVDVKYVAPPKFNVHFIQPKPTDVRNVSNADLYVDAGLDLEAWSDSLLEAAGKPELFRGRERNVDMSKGIRLLDIPDHPLSRAEGDIHLFGNPHFNMNPENAEIMAGNILEKLKSIDPENASYYETNEKAFVSHLQEKITEWKKFCAGCKGEEVISYHKDIAYFADFLGIKAEQYIEPKPGIPPTPKHLEFLEKYVKANHIKAIVMPTYYPKDAAEALAKRVGAKVVIICQNPGELPDTDDIFSFFDYNFRQISEALK